MTSELRDQDGTTRLRGDLLIGGTTGDVATVQADGTVAPAPGGSLPVQSVTVPLTNAQIKTLPSTPITLVVTPGNGQALRPLQAFLVSDFSAGAYTGVVANTNYPNLSVGVGDGSLAPIYDDPDVSDQLSAFLSANDSCVDMPLSFALTSAGGLHVLPIIRPHTDVEDLPLVIAISNDSGGGPVDLGGGHVDNTLAVTVLYTLIDV